MEERNYFKYWFKVGNCKVHCGITNDLKRREEEHKNSGKSSKCGVKRVYWLDGHIEQVGNAVTKESAMDWERENGCNENWN